MVCRQVARGNFSGEVSPAMVQECGAGWIILGHPERRTIFGETDDLIADKVKHALNAGAKVGVCVSLYTSFHLLYIKMSVCLFIYIAVKRHT